MRVSQRACCAHALSTVCGQFCAVIQRSALSRCEGSSAAGAQMAQSQEWRSRLRPDRAHGGQARERRLKGGPDSSRISRARVRRDSTMQRKGAWGGAGHRRSAPAAYAHQALAYGISTVSRPRSWLRHWRWRYRWSSFVPERRPGRLRRPQRQPLAKAPSDGTGPAPGTGDGHPGGRRFRGRAATGRGRGHRRWLGRPAGPGSGTSRPGGRGPRRGGGRGG
jgi:hypothetical protein